MFTVLGIVGSIASIYSVVDKTEVIDEKYISTNPQYVSNLKLTKNAICDSTLGVVRLESAIDHNYLVSRDSINFIMRNIIRKSNCFVVVNRNIKDAHISYERSLMKNRTQVNDKLIGADYFIDTRIIFRKDSTNDLKNFVIIAYHSLIDIRTGIELASGSGESKKTDINNNSDFDENLTNACLDGYLKIILRIREYAN